MREYFKSYLKIYYTFWLLMLAIYIILYLLYNPENLFMYYIVITLLFAMIINGYEGNRINKYLKKYYKEQYLKNKSYKGVELIHNGFNAFAFLFSNSTDKDINRLKLNYKKIILLVFLIFFSYPILFFILA